MHSCTPCRFSTAERVTFYKARSGLSARGAPAGRAPEKTLDLSLSPGACLHLVIYLMLAGGRLMTLENGAYKVTGLL